MIIIISINKDDNCNKNDDSQLKKKIVIKVNMNTSNTINSINSINSINTTCTTTADKADEAPQHNHLRRHLEVMIVNQDWGNITQMLKEYNKSSKKKDKIKSDQSSEEEEEEEVVVVEKEGKGRNSNKKSNTKDKEEEEEEESNKSKSLKKCKRKKKGNKKSGHSTSHVDVIFEILFPSNNNNDNNDNDNHGADNDLRIKLLKERKNKKAKALLAMLIRLGRRKFVMDKFYFKMKNGQIWSRYVGTLLHAACGLNASIDIISLLVKVGGGKTFVLQKDICGETILHFACKYNISLDVVSLLIEVGGEELVMATDNSGETSLHFECSNHHKVVSIDVISKLVEVGGKALVMKKDQWGFNSFHLACQSAYHHKKFLLHQHELLDLLTQHCGAEIFTQTDQSGKTPLQFFITKDAEDLGKQDVDYTVLNASLLISKGIKAQVEGEYGIGGLFTTTTTSSVSNQEVQSKIYDNWDRIVLPALEQVMAFPHDRQLPILQALVANDAPPQIIKRTINHFPESTKTADIFGMYPIDLAVRHGLVWWDSGMKEMLKGTNLDIIERKDVLTGLYPFMVAALGGKKNGYDVDSVFHLINANPTLLRWSGVNHVEEQRPKKRQRCV